MFRRERGVVYGVMNDFDLGQISDVEREGYKGERTGTRLFMSISLHLGSRRKAMNMLMAPPQLRKASKHTSNANRVN